METRCATVVTSTWSMLFDTISLPLAGSVVYGAVALMALLQLTTPELDVPRRARYTKLAILSGAASLASTSAYLLHVLATRFPADACAWCLASAAFSFGIAAASVSTLEREDLRGAVVAVGGAVTLTSLTLALGTGQPSETPITSLAYHAASITTESSEETVALAHRLRAAGARMYGAFWCEHCYDQKQGFGREAMSAFPYVECYPTGWHPGSSMDRACATVPGGLEHFPTWVIGGQKTEGELTLEQLEQRLSVLGL